MLINIITFFTCESSINIFAIVRRGGGGQRVMIGIIVVENVYNYGRSLSE